MTSSNYRRQGSKGKGSDTSSANSGSEDTGECENQTMEFTPHTAGKHQPVTHDIIEKHILEVIQKDSKNGLDMAVNLRRNTRNGNEGKRHPLTD